MAVNERNVGGGGAERDPQLEGLYREAAREAPPPHLDAALLAAARREVGARPRSSSSALRRWHVPVSIAAVVIVSVSLVILVREEGGERIGEARVPTVATPADQPAAAAKETARPQTAAPAPAEHRGSREDAKRSAALNKLEDTGRRETGSAAVSGAGVVATPEPAAESLPRPIVAAPPRAAEERAAPAAPDTFKAGRTAGAPAAPSELRSARPAADAPPSKPMARAMAVKPTEQDRLPPWHGFEYEPPEKWLARIEELKGQGRTGEAEEMQSEFKRRFPGHPQAAGPR